MRKVVLAVVGGLVVTVGFGALLLASLKGASSKPAGRQSPMEAARTFHTKLTRQLVEPVYTQPLPVPDALYQRVEYDGPSGKLWAYLSRPEAEQRGRPAIVWISGGFPPGGFPSAAWLDQDPTNDQSAGQYVRAGVLTLYPTTRGMEGNAGAQESFLGEVEDVVSAVNWLRAQPYVDPQRIYVGGHSTGGTLALLVGASTAVAGVISFGPIGDVCNYGQGVLAFDSDSEEECAIRAPLTYATQFSPSVIVEGAWSANAETVRALGRTPSKGSSYVVIPRDEHFFHVAAMNEAFARKIARGEALTLTVEEAVAVLERKFPPIVVGAAGGWSVTVPAGYSELESEPGPRFFKSALTRLRVSLEAESPVSCEEPGAVKGRGAECFSYGSETDDEGAETIYLTAQRGSALFISVAGPKSQEKALLAELTRVLDGAKVPGR